MDLPIRENDYKVTSVTRTQINEQEWYEYTISNNITTIKGQRQGTLKQVNQHAQEYSEQLNERLKSNTGYYKSSKQKKK